MALLTILVIFSVLLYCLFVSMITSVFFLLVWCTTTHNRTLRKSKWKPKILEIPMPWNTTVCSNLSCLGNLTGFRFYLSLVILIFKIVFHHLLASRISHGKLKVFPVHDPLCCWKSKESLSVLFVMPENSSVLVLKIPTSSCMDFSPC